MPRRFEKISYQVIRVADRLSKAENFNKDEITIRLIFLKEIGDVWAKDIMYHNNYMNKYISKFQRDVKKLLAADFENSKKMYILKTLLTMWLVVWTFVPMVTHFRMFDIC